MLILNVHLVQGAIEKYNNIAKEIKLKKKKNSESKINANKS